jgi:hypothetical protein
MANRTGIPFASAFAKHPFLKTLLGGVAVVIAFYLLFWPALVFHRNPGWVGEGFWVAFLLLTAAVIAVADSLSEDEKASKKSEESPAAEAMQLEAERAAFENEIRVCFKDRRIAKYFSRGLVDGYAIVDAIMAGPAFAIALTRNSYQSYAKSRDHLQAMEKAKSALTSGSPFNYRAVTSIVGLVLFAALIFTEISGVSALASGLAFIPLLLGIIFVATTARAMVEPRYRLRKVVTASAVLAALICSIGLESTLADFNWPVILLPISLIALFVSYFLADGYTLWEILGLIAVLWIQAKIYLIFEFVKQDSQLLAEWLDDCSEDVIMPQTVLAIKHCARYR